MTVRTMTEARFADLAQAWGGDLRRWPEAEREAARAWRCPRRCATGSSPRPRRRA